MTIEEAVEILERKDIAFSTIRIHAGRSTSLCPYIALMYKWGGYPNRATYQTNASTCSEALEHLVDLILND